jgi:hypothetical protein
MIQAFLKPISVGGLVGGAILLILLGIYLGLFGDFVTEIARYSAYAMILGIGLLLALFIAGPLPAPIPIKGTLLAIEFVGGAVAWLSV